MRFGICMEPEHCVLAASAGFDYIEPMVVGALEPESSEVRWRDELAPILAALPLKAEAFNCFLPGDLKVVGTGIDSERQERYTRSAFQRAASIGGEVIVFGSGRSRGILPGVTVEQANKDVKAFVTLCGIGLGEAGIELVVEPLHRAECNFINSVAEGAAIARSAGSPSVGVLADLYHITMEGQDYSETAAAGTLLRHVHVAGKENRRAPCRDDSEFLMEFFRVLKTSGYDRRISIECAWVDLASQIHEASEVLREAWERA